MRRVLTPLFLCVLALASCAPVTEKTAELNPNVIQSLSTFREGERVTFTWGISGEVPTYATWLEFYHENVSSFLVGPPQYVHREVVEPNETTFFYDTFKIREVASFSREGARETYTLLFHVVLKEPGGRTVRSELNQMTFFTIVSSDGEK